MPVMQELVINARSEVHILAYVITRAATPLLQLLEQALSRGVRVTVVVNVIPGQPLEMSAELRRLASEFQHAKIRVFDDEEGSQLHAKVLIADRQRAVIGSANYSWGGLVANHEMGVLVDDRMAWELAELTDRLAAAAAPIMEGNSGG